MEAATSLDSNANHSVTVSSNNNAAESTADRDQRPRARYGFGFKPPQAKHGRPGPRSRVTGPTMPLPLPPSGGDGAAADDGERLPVNGETAGHVANGVGDGRASAPPRGPPAAGSKKRPKDAADAHRQTTAGRTNKQSALRRPGQRASATGSSQQPPQQRVRRVTPSTSDHSTQLLNGKASAPANGRGRSSTDKSVKLLVNYRSTNDRHAPLHSAYGNRDFFGPSSSSSMSNATSARGTADASAGCPLAAPRTGNDDVKQPVHSSPSRLVCSRPQRTFVPSSSSSSSSPSTYCSTHAEQSIYQYQLFAVGSGCSVMPNSSLFCVFTDV